MENTSKKKNKEERPVIPTKDEMLDWALDWAMARREGTLSQEKIKQLNDIGFRWEYYEGYADGAMTIYEEYTNRERIWKTEITKKNI